MEVWGEEEELETKRRKIERGMRLGSDWGEEMIDKLIYLGYKGKMVKLPL